MKSPETTSGASAEQIRRLHEEYLWPAVANYYAEPIVPDYASGTRLTDKDGKTYLDFFGGILTISIGHTDSRITRAMKVQMERLGHVSSVYPVDSVVQLAATLARITPGDLQKTYFVASGTEADEAAVNIAQTYTQNHEIIALRHGYAGRSLLAQSITGHAPWRSVPTQVAAVKHAPAPYCYRCPFKLKYPDCGVQCAKDIEEIIKTTTVGQVAGLMAEPILGVGGFITPPREYFEIAAKVVRRYGGVFISDEVQTGFGRTGEWFGINHYGVEPDVMTLAKGIANGAPLAACIATAPVADSFQSLTISTFGGNPVSCAAANAALDIMESEDLPHRAQERGARLRGGLENLKKKYPRVIGDVRGKGLMQALELVKDEEGGDRSPSPEAMARLFEETKNRGLLIGKGGLAGNCVRISPPLTVSEAEVDEAVSILDASFQALVS